MDVNYRSDYPEALDHFGTHSSLYWTATKERQFLNEECSYNPRSYQRYRMGIEYETDSNCKTINIIWKYLEEVGLI